MCVLFSVKRLTAKDIGPLFNVMAGKHLFYPKERFQYRQIIQRDGGTQNLCNIFGAVHLLRLFGKSASGLSSSSSKTSPLAGYHT